MGSALRFAALLPRPLRGLLKRLPGASRVFRSGLGQPGGTEPGPGDLRHVVYLPTWLSWDRMPERPHYVLKALAAAGHPVSFVDLRLSERSSGRVNIVGSLDAVPPAGVAMYIHYPPHAGYIDIFEEAVVIYDILDDLSLYERQTEARNGHRVLMERADVVMASSEVLADRHRAERSDILVVPNGVEAARFAAGGVRPVDLGGGTIIGYHGAVERWFDFELLGAVAAERPTWRFVVVGPIGADVTAAAAEAARAPNVDFLGERPAASMPAYVGSFDVSAIWFRLNDLTTAVSPLKMYESLAAGTPVVSVPLPTAIAEPDVRTASNALEFSDQLALALSGDAPAPRNDADWERRVATLITVLDERQLRRVKG